MDLNQQIEELTRRMECIEQEMAGVSRVMTLMDKTIRSHEEVLQKNGIGELRNCVGELKTLLYGDAKVGAPGLISQFNEARSETSKLIRQRDMLKWILVGVGLASAGQTTLLISIANKVFGGS